MGSHECISSMASADRSECLSQHFIALGSPERTCSSGRFETQLPDRRRTSRNPHVNQASAGLCFVGSSLGLEALQAGDQFAPRESDGRIFHKQLECGVEFARSGNFMTVQLIDHPEHAVNFDVFRFR